MKSLKSLIKEKEKACDESTQALNERTERFERFVHESTQSRQAMVNHLSDLKNRLDEQNDVFLDLNHEVRLI
eukprot:Pgem_evm2s340